MIVDEDGFSREDVRDGTEEASRDLACCRVGGAAWRITLVLTGRAGLTALGGVRTLRRFVNGGI